MAEPTTEDVRIPLPDGSSLRGFLARPDGTGPHPGVVVLHEMFGLNDDIRRITRRLASEGYVAVCPDLYSHGTKLTCLTRVVMDSFRGARDQTIADIDAARRFLADRSDVDSARVAVIGFCQGGGFALAYAAKGDVGAASVNYGAVPRRKERLEGTCPVVASYGSLDRTMKGHPERLERYLTELGVPNDVKVYDGVGHSFLSYDNAPRWMARLPSPMHLGYSEKDAEDAWRRILTFFEEHLGATRAA